MTATFDFKEGNFSNTEKLGNKIWKSRIKLSTSYTMKVWCIYLYIVLVLQHEMLYYFSLLGCVNLIIWLVYPGSRWKTGNLCLYFSPASFFHLCIFPSPFRSLHSAHTLIPLRIVVIWGTDGSKVILCINKYSPNLEIQIMSGQIMSDCSDNSSCLWTKVHKCLCSITLSSPEDGAWLFSVIPLIYFHSFCFHGQWCNRTRVCGFTAPWLSE